MTLYAALIWTEGPAESDAELDRYRDFGARADAEGFRKGGHALHRPETATTIRYRDDEILMTDGPFIDSKEQIHGFFLFECANLDEAIEWAAQIPGARHGAIEVRPVLTH